jgi:hypothetical protein
MVLRRPVELAGVVGKFNLMGKRLPLSIPTKRTLHTGESMATTRVGDWHAGGPADKEYRAEYSDFPSTPLFPTTLPMLIHVTVQTATGQQFPVPSSLVDQIGAPPPPGHAYSLELFLRRSPARYAGPSSGPPPGVSTSPFSSRNGNFTASRVLDKSVQKYFP